jgi:uncharacterized protein (DUF1800 family)
MPPLDKFTGQLGARNAAHLLRRATFGPTPSGIESFTSLNIDQAMEILFADVAPPSSPVDPQTGTTWLNPSATGSNSSQEDLIDYFLAWQLENYRTGGTSVRERIVWFLHTHMPTSREKVIRSESIYYQNALYRYYAFDSFKTLFRKICIDNAMLVYLDNGLNDAASPNENFAREMFELYSIGRGPQIAEGNYTNYTESDIRAAARVLTGYQADETYSNNDADTGIPIGRLITTGSGVNEIANRHDPGSKQFSAAFQNRIIAPSALVDGYASRQAAEAELDDLIDMIFDQDETARFITRKIYRHFVYYRIDDEIETNIIRPLATQFKSSGYSLPSLIRTLLSSIHFFDTDNADNADDTRGAIIKSPIDLIIGVCRLFDINFPAASSTLYKTVYQEGLIDAVYRQGLDLYKPFDVAGYDAYYQFPSFNRSWITPYNLAYRYQFADRIMSGTNHQGNPLGIQLDILSWVQDTANISDPSDASILVSRLIELLFPFTIKSDREAFFRDQVLLDGLYASAWTDEWNSYLSDPGTFGASVRSTLENLLRALMQSPEFQLY